MKVITTRTSELDDKEKAFKAISEQITAHGELEKNTVGVMFCHYEFIFSGVAEYIAEKLPFPVVGSSTTLAGFNKSEDACYVNGQFRLVLLIVSSDHIEFTPVLTEPITRGMTAADICKNAIGNIGKQNIGVLLIPHIMLTDTEALIEEVTGCTAAQLFGGFAVDDSPTYIENCFVIAKGKAYRDRAVMLFVKGEIHPQFVSAIVTEDKYLENSAIITEAKDSEIISLNGRPVTEFLTSLGFSLTGSKADAINSAVMIVTEPGEGGADGKSGRDGENGRDGNANNGGVTDGKSGTGKGGRDGNANSGGVTDGKSTTCNSDTYGRSMMYLTPDNHLFVGGKVNTGSTIRIDTFDQKRILDA
jgi:hypothetical protein